MITENLETYFQLFTYKGSKNQVRLLHRGDDDRIPSNHINQILVTMPSDDIGFFQCVFLEYAHETHDYVNWIHEQDLRSLNFKDEQTPHVLDTALKKLLVIKGYVSAIQYNVNFEGKSKPDEQWMIHIIRDKTKIIRLMQRYRGYIQTWKRQGKMYLLYRCDNCSHLRAYADVKESGELSREEVADLNQILMKYDKLD